MQPKIIVTGTGGTIGKIILRELAHLNIMGISRLTCDLSNPNHFRDMIDTQKPEVIVHCAVAGVKINPNSFDNHALINNLQMIENIVAHAHQVQHIFNIGSGAEYGTCFDINNVTEAEISTYMLPCDSYGLSKRLSWQRLQQVSNATTLRIFGCFDPIEPTYRLMRRFVNHMHKGEDFELKSNRNFSWISGTDLAQVIEQLIMIVSTETNQIPKTINVAYKETASMNLTNMLDQWCYLHDKSPLNKRPDRWGKPYTCDSTLMYTMLSKPLKGLSASLKDYI